MFYFILNIYSPCKFQNYPLGEKKKKSQIPRALPCHFYSYKLIPVKDLTALSYEEFSVIKYLRENCIQNYSS